VPSRAGSLWIASRSAWLIAVVVIRPSARPAKSNFFMNALSLRGFMKIGWPDDAGGKDARQRQIREFVSVCAAI